MIYFNELYILSMFAASIVFWNVVADKYKSKFLIIASALALAFIQPLFTVFLFGLVAFVFYSSKLIDKDSKTNGKPFVLITIVLVIVLLGFKYMGIMFEEIFKDENSFSSSYLVPLGISYLSFKLIAYVIDIYRGFIEDPDFEQLLLFIFFLPAFPAGPIEKYQNFAHKRASVFSWDDYSEGLKRIVYGYLKKVVLVNFVLHEIVFKRLYPYVTADGIQMDLSAFIIVAYLVGALIYSYLDLSGYADIAIGFSLLFGYKICENMNYPIFAKNLGDYWTRWHMSLSNWCRNNIYFPVLGKTRNNNLALYSSFFIMGMWHFVSLNWFLWGLWHATGIILYKKWDRLKRKKFKKIKVPAIIGTALGVSITVVYSGLGFSFITMSNATEALRLLLAIIL